MLKIGSFLNRLLILIKGKSSRTVFSNRLINQSNAQFGDYTYGIPTIFDWGEGKKLKVGKFCAIASDVKIFLGGGHRTDWITTYPFNVLNDEFPHGVGIVGHPISKGDVVIGNDVWIGQGATILSGVTIGDGAAIGAYSVVTRDVEPYSIVAGNPARLIKKRFSDRDIEFLTKIKWWNWSVDMIDRNVKLLCSENVDGLRNLVNDNTEFASN